MSHPLRKKDNQPRHEEPTYEKRSLLDDMLSDPNLKEKIEEQERAATHAKTAEALQNKLTDDMFENVQLNAPEGKPLRENVFEMMKRLRPEDRRTEGDKAMQARLDAMPEKSKILATMRAKKKTMRKILDMIAKGELDPGKVNLCMICGRTDCPYSSLGSDDWKALAEASGDQDLIDEVNRALG